MGKAFMGGIHPNDGKKYSENCAICEMPILEEYIVPLSQHIGAPAKLVVNEGERVLKGQLLADPAGAFSAAIHSPTSGIITGIGRVSSTGEMFSSTNCIGPAGTLIAAVTIKSDKLDEACEPMPEIFWRNANSEDLLKRVRDAGIVGMGGAAFPSAVKLAPTEPVDTLVLNGAECEPFLTADYRLMLERATEIIEGALITAKILKVDNIIIGIEDNKPLAIKTMKKAAEDKNVKITQLPTHYPQGAEKQLVYATTKRIIPTAKFPMNVGCVVQNVGTVFAIYEAVVKGLSLFKRITTVTGVAVKNPKNVEIRIGTPLQKILEFVGGIKENITVRKVIIGGPMMGMAQYSLAVPLMKNASGVLLLTEDEITQYESQPCIRCGKCVKVCPMNLLPCTTSVQIEREKYDLAEGNNVMSCIECGCCAYSCPSLRPLTQLFRRAKGFINQQRRLIIQKQGDRK